MAVSFTAEGVLKEALVRLWEQARAKKVESIGVLTIRMFEAGDAFRLLGAVGAVSGADKIVTITGGYETREARATWSSFRRCAVRLSAKLDFPSDGFVRQTQSGVSRFR